MTDIQNQKLWQTVYDERSRFFESNFGSLPKHILKIGHLFDAWPGGGLYKLEASKAGKGLWLYTTFGLSNADLPATVTTTNVNDKSEQSSAAVLEKEKVILNSDRPGYGYEIMLFANESSEWPLRFLQWAASVELLNDRDILGQVEKNDGLIVEDIAVGEGLYVNVLIHKAVIPFPQSMKLSTGQAQLLIATVITDDEKAWSDSFGRIELLLSLKRAGVGQLSVLNRGSIFHPEPLDFSKITNTETAVSLQEKGLLRKIHLFPIELGGEDSEINSVYLPRTVALQKKEIDKKIMKLAQRGKIKNYATKPSYKDESYIPESLEIETTGAGGFKKHLSVW